MNKRIDLTKTDGFPYSQDMLDFMQQSYRDAIAAIASAQGPLVIVTGVADLGADWGNGWVAINGELMPFVGGTKAARVIVTEDTGTEVFEDTAVETVYFTKQAVLAGAGGNLFTDFVRIKTQAQVKSDIDGLTASVANKADQSALTALTATVASKADQSALTALSNVAIEADTKIKVKKLTATWDMDANSQILLAHGLPDHKKIIGAKGRILSNGGVPYVIGWALNDGGLGVIDFPAHFITYDRGGTPYPTSTNIGVTRKTGGTFDNASFNAAALTVHLFYEG